MPEFQLLIGFSHMWREIAGLGNSSGVLLTTCLRGNCIHHSLLSNKQPGIYAPFVDPSLNANEAEFLWSEEASSFVLSVFARKPTGHGVCQLLDLRDLDCRVHVVTVRPDLHHVLLADSHTRLQLAIHGAVPDGPLCLTAIRNHGLSGISKRLRMWRALEYLMAHHKLPSRIHRAEAGAYRLLLILLALDGARSQTPAKDTATLLFGEKRVQAHWRSDGRAMRAQISRAIARGEWLAAGGYRSLLR